MARPAPNGETDERLMAGVASGSEAALAELVHRYEVALYQFVFRHGVGRDSDDVCQETWLRVVRSATRFDRRRRFSTWLFQIALNLCRDWHRRRPPDPVDVASPRTSEGARPDEPRQDVAAPGAGAPSSPSADDLLDARRLLGMLPEAQRSVLLLRYYHGFSEDEVAEILDCPRGTVKSRLHHAIARLLELSRDRPAPPVLAARSAGGKP